LAVKAPFLSKQTVALRADAFLQKFNNTGVLPVGIEFIAESQLNLDIVPVSGLQSAFDIEAFISVGKSEIRVDDYVYQNRINRFRFSLAHEIGHLTLHGNVWEQLKFTNISEWKAVINSIDEREYRFLESQANTFAGHVLVPPAPLKRAYDSQVENLNTNGLSVSESDPETLSEFLCKDIAKEFEVSVDVVRRRIAADELLD
jgi:hypothetical protein